ncbi:LysR family transcriptional regulator [Corallococcus sp. H22C18031201]|uniref:LysR family transcriptional regulator n=1 Tax=Citreicoccus inhibens TaxID=2849499 RepID=UPI000E77136B|nr:LysR family transcriptional regulator [Citreicoccus inhibens]MBU8894072.1 LysR family transcriptional regulator [Citreicoccus inhibens]RJS23210.1 LysR family transcriptional regulator [Corallococcus sp. H22C18031201]
MSAKREPAEELVWDDLRVFTQIALHGSQSAAGRALGLDHATVGRRVRRLERALGRELVVPQSSGFTLTPDGEAVLARARAMEEQALSVSRFAAGASSLTGTVRLTTVALFAERYLAPKLASFQAAHPGIVLEVFADDRNLSLARREADIALRLARPQHGESLVARRLAVIGHGLYASESYLEQFGDAPLEARRFIGLTATHRGLPEVQWLETFLRQGGRIVHRVNQHGGLLGAARAGIGLAVMPHYLARAYPELRSVPFSSEGPLVRELWLLMHQDMQAVPRVRSLVDHLVLHATRDAALLLG